MEVPSSRQTVSVVLAMMGACKPLRLLLRDMSGTSLQHQKDNDRETDRNLQIIMNMEYYTGFYRQ